MVGLQASLHTSVGDGIADLAKHHKDPLSSEIHDDEDVFAEDDFDPEELLNSPLFNDSESKFPLDASFGSFHTDYKSTPSLAESSVSQGFEHSDTGKLSSSSSLTPFVSQPHRTPGTPTKSSVSAGSSAYVPSFQPQSPPKLHQLHQVDNGFSMLQQMQQQQQPPQQPHPAPASGSVNMHSSPIRSVSYHGSGQSLGNQMSTRMDNFQMQQMQLQINQVGHSNLSQSLHEVPFNGEHRMISVNTSYRNGVDSLASSMHNDSMHSQQVNVSTTPSAPPFGTFAGNVSIATEMQSSKPNFQVYDQPGMAQPQNAASLNEAMEKLCESMKRSAMTRSLVKQISGRSLVSQGRQGSSRGLLSRQNSGLMGKQRSNRSLMDESSGRGAPIRRMSNSKHHIQHHGRALYRHDSQQSLNSQSNHGISLHIDGRNMGAF